MSVQKNNIRYQWEVLLLVIVAVTASSLFFSCNKRVSENTQTAIESDSVVTKLSILQDSLTAAWDEMIRDDDEKLGYMRRVLKEISNSNYKPGKIDELNALVDELKAMRYTQETMRSSALIDEYDSATSKVIRQVFDFAYEYPDFEESQLVKDLLKEINQKNNYVLIYRVHYDGFAEEINSMVEIHGEMLEERGVEVGKLPLFKLSVEEI